MDNIRRVPRRGESALGETRSLRLWALWTKTGGEDIAAREEGGVEEPTETEDVSKPSWGVREAPKAGEEGMKSLTGAPA